MSQETINYKLYKYEDEDIADLKKLGPTMEIIDEELKKASDNDTTISGNVQVLEEKVDNHIASTMPHRFVNHQEGKTYKYGIQVSPEGKPQIIYEEVI